MFLTPVENEPDETGVTHRPSTTFSRVLNDLYDHPDQFKSVTPSDSWLEWLQELDGLTSCLEGLGGEAPLRNQHPSNSPDPSVSHSSGLFAAEDGVDPQLQV